MGKENGESLSAFWGWNLIGAHSWATWNFLFVYFCCATGHWVTGTYYVLSLMLACRSLYPDMVNDVLITVCVLLLWLESVWHFKERTLYACVFNWGEARLSVCKFLLEEWKRMVDAEIAMWREDHLPESSSTSLSQVLPETHTLVEFHLFSSTNDWLISGLLNLEHSRVKMVFVRNGVIWTGKPVMDKS